MYAQEKRKNQDITRSSFTWINVYLKHRNGALHDQTYLCSASGDVYIILQTVTSTGGGHTHSIYLWKGAKAPQDNVDAGYKFMTGIGEQLEGEIGQHKQLQGSESVDFCELFPAGITYKESHNGGSSQHGKQGRVPLIEPKLYQLRQKKGRHPKLEPVDLDLGSLNSGGSFIFERPGYLTVWTGKFVPTKMQGKLRKVMKKIGEERGGQPEITFLQEGGIDDATMSFYASLGAGDPNNVTIAPPCPEESQAGSSPKADSQREDSADSEDSISGVIILGESADADTTEVNSSTSGNPEEQASRDKTLLSGSKDKEVSAKDRARSKGPESPKLVHMEEGKAGSASRSTACSESADDREDEQQEAEKKPNDGIEAKVSNKPDEVPAASTLKTEKDLSAEGLASKAEHTEDSNSADIKQHVEQKAKEAATEKLEDKEGKSAPQLQSDRHVPAESDSRGNSLTSPELSTAAKATSSPAETPQAVIDVPLGFQDQNEAMISHDDSKDPKANSAELKADIAAVDKVKAIMQAPFSVVSPHFRLSHEEPILPASKEDSKKEASKDGAEDSALAISHTENELQMAERNAADQELKASPAEPTSRPKSAKLEEKGEDGTAPAEEASDKAKGKAPENVAHVKPASTAPIVQGAAFPASSLPGSPASQWSTSSPTAKPASMYMLSALPSSGPLPTPRQPREGNGGSPVHDFLKARSALRRSPSSQERAAARPPPIKCPPGIASTRDASDLLRNARAAGESDDSSAGSKGSSAKSQQEDHAALSNPKLFTDLTAPSVPKVVVSIEPGSCTFPYADLKGMKADSGIDMAKKEDYLAAGEFEQVFGHPIAAFKSLPRWKQIAAKKEKGIF